MFPDAIAYLIIRVICSQLEWTDDEGQPLTTPRKVTVYRELRPTLAQAHRALWLTVDQETTNRDPLRPRFTVDHTWLKVWVMKTIVGDDILHTVVKALEAGTPPSRAVDGLELQVVPEWKAAWRHPDELLRFAAKHSYSSETKAAILAEVAHRKAERKAKKASRTPIEARRDAAMELAAHW